MTQTSSERDEGTTEVDRGADPGPAPGTDTNANTNEHAVLPATDAEARERLLVETTVDAPQEAVWAALRDPERIRRWFGWDDAGLGAEVHQIFHDEVTADDDARTLTWADGDRIEVHPAESRAAGRDGERDSAHGGEPGSDHGDQGPDGSSALTRVRLVRRGHPEAAWDGVHDPVDEGWITFVQQLRFLLERHPDADRRTVRAADLDLGPDDDALLDRLGLRSLGDDPVGGRYTVSRPDGSTFGGEVFFQTDLQIGLSVDEEDDALLVVARTPPASAPPHGTVTFLLSVFGDVATDDERRKATEQRWRSWWGDDASAG
jgi:hypothetical protein